MAKQMDNSGLSQLMASELRVAPAPTKQNSESITLPQPRPAEAPKEALSRWEDEGGHLTETGNGKN